MTNSAHFVSTISSETILDHEIMVSFDVDSPGDNQNWVCGDVMKNGNMATKDTHTTLISSELFLGPKSSLFPTRLCTKYD